MTNENLKRVDSKEKVDEVADAMIISLVGIMAYRVLSDIFKEEKPKRRFGKKKKINVNADRIL